jgi:hypothetical protein
VAQRERWLDALWPFVREWLPDAPARVVETSEADEQAAIDAGLIQANRILYAGRRAASSPRTGPAPHSARCRQEPAAA